MNEVYLHRAGQLARARELMRDEPDYASATALLSVHSAIAMTDALLILMSGSRSRGQDHSAAAILLKKACGERKIQARGVKHLRNLLSAKSDVSYGDRSVTLDRAQKLASESELFEVWAYEALKEV